MTVGEDRNKYFKTDSFAIFESSRFVTTAIELTQNCVYFTPVRLHHYLELYEVFKMACSMSGAKIIFHFNSSTFISV